ncbi:hypothetical protein ABZX66_20910 [Micromonospora aurantiaca]|uniref:hypothetical protein n=1 Tax=Micromonospora aurantiaca (nom. illeg.) TaxID=47850 RepID=UPI0033B71A81
MNISAVRAGIATNANAIQGLNCYGYVPDSISEPAFYAAEVDVNYDTSYGSLDELMVTCRVLVGRADDAASQALLDDYLSRGDRSLKAAIEADCTLGGACDDLRVQRVQGYRYYEHQNSKFIGAELVVQVIGTPEE